MPPVRFLGPTPARRLVRSIRVDAEADGEEAATLFRGGDPVEISDRQLAALRAFPGYRFEVVGAKATKAELDARARELEIEGRSNMDRDELAAAIAAAEADGDGDGS